MEKRMAEERFNTKMEMFTMVSGIKGKYTVLVVILKTKTIDFSKVFGEEGSIVDKRLRSNKILFNFFDFNNFTRLSFILFILFIKVFFLFRVFLFWFKADDISVLIDIISWDHFWKILIFVVFAISFISVAHVVNHYIIDLFNYIFSKFW